MHMDWKHHGTDLQCDPAVPGLDVGAGVADVTAHLVVGEVRLLHHPRGIHRHLRIRLGFVPCVSGTSSHRSSVVDAHLEHVVTRRHVGDVDPLAVNVGVIRVVATWTEALEKRLKLLTKALCRIRPVLIQAVTFNSKLYSSCISVLRFIS